MNRHNRKPQKHRGPPVLWLLVLVALLFLVTSSVYYVRSDRESCARCHEIQESSTLWSASTHRSVACKDCHGSALTLDVAFHTGNLRRLLNHVRGNIPKQPWIQQRHVPQLVQRCRACHEQEFADWKAGPHGVTYAMMFLDKNHNQEELLIDECLDCHGMFYEGGIKDLVTPLDTKGPWRLKHPDLADQPAIPCLTCHNIHREGLPSGALPAQAEIGGPSQELFRPSLALFSRDAHRYISVRRLPLPKMKTEDQPVQLSPDPRQSLCYQCHAPTATFEAGSDDDRTCTGVHEGIGCLACHQGHRQNTRASCAACHPRLSNCGLDVETMDTTFRSPDSPHDIHSVKCIDCHPGGVPERPKKTEDKPETR